ncbi:MAG: hypothetical protein A2V98_02350 [Planctomycetes bacterium RBG_16_64_12]|nr:MAG: hypothetical protein A2V98_02350 [Planctomycetes bacterium RBG_16_64_12]
MPKQTSGFNEDSDGGRVVIGSWGTLHGIVVRPKHNDFIRTIATIKLGNEIDGVTATHRVRLPNDRVIQCRQLPFNKRRRCG